MNSTPIREIIYDLVTENTIKGGWSNNIVQDCVDTLNSLNIQSMDDLGGVNIPDIKIPLFLKEHLIRIHSERNIFDSFEFQGQANANSLLTVTKNTIKTCISPKKKQDTLNQPVTFRQKVKSSGYLAEPKAMKLFQLPKTSNLKVKTKSLTRVDDNKQIPDTKLDFSVENMVDMNHTHQVTSVTHSICGKYFFASSADKSAKLCSTKTGRIKTFTGHNGLVSDISASLKSDKNYGLLAITSGNDGSCKVWSTERTDQPLLNITSTTNKKSDTVLKFMDEVQFGRFLNQDSIIMLNHKNSIHAYQYMIDKPETGSVKPLLNYNKCWCVQSYKVPSHNVTALACMNSIKSNVLLGACSDKAIYLWDINRDRPAFIVPDAASRPIHHLEVLDCGRTGTSFDQLFVSSAVMDPIKLWDIRRPDKEVMQLYGHVNKYLKVRQSMSPCGQYVVSGSEVSIQLN
jgi:WD40 repeat protein